MKIKFNLKSDVDLIILEAGAREKIRTLIIKSLNACVSMEQYRIPYDLNSISDDYYKRPRLYTLTLRKDRDAAIIDMLEQTVDCSLFIKCLLRCYAFGCGYPDYKLLNIAYMKSHFFNEALASCNGSNRSSDNDDLPSLADKAVEELINITKMELM